MSESWSTDAEQGLPAPPDIPKEIARQAVEWLVEWQSGDMAADRQEAFRRWHEANPDHRSAWRHIEQVNQHLRDLGGPQRAPLARATLLTPPLSSRARKRRQVVQSLVAALFLGGGAWITRDAWPEWRADLRTAVGERATHRLDDGTELTLNTDSAVDVRFNDQERRLRLLAGEIMVTTGQDTRPLVIDTGQGELHPLGTRFNVRILENAVRLSVLEGVVAIRPRGQGREAARVPAGQQRRFNAFGVAPAAPLDDNAAAWTHGMLVASNQRLADFLAELGRYRNGTLSCDPAVADLRLSGTYPLADSDRVLTALPGILPVEVRFLTRYWVRILPKSSSG
ncbi:FecR domain-containing protein [Alcanivorax sp. 24]|uniref:FecR domain-containing protein n=1 Tax=Alcanivorax sp. 24 TaxID=2545266 RepID=UPI00105EC07C|nr:FecR domain-containing protein [Alcanivorax sp. 24]